MNLMESAIILLKQRASELNHNGFNFELKNQLLQNNEWQITVSGKVSVEFSVRNDDGIFHLVKDGKPLQFLKDGLVNFMLIEANNGPELGKLVPEGWPKEHCKHLEMVAAT